MDKTNGRFRKVSSSMDFVSREREIAKFWNENDIFKKSVELRKGGEAGIFTFYDGPPTANGKPHIGHIITRLVKDLIPRYRTMKGYEVLRKAGWDTHGLPVEIEVEKEIGISGKPEIEKYGIEAFNDLCKKSVWKYTNEWKTMSEKVAYWVDMEDPYVTYDNNYIESVWWAIKQIANKGLLYKGHKIVPYCPRCGTSLSSHEVAQGYKDVKETSIFVKFALKDEENTFFLAWTTTPWTLPSNVALAVNPRERYVKVRLDDCNLILAKELAGQMLKSEYEVIAEYAGAELEYMEYKPLFDYAEVDKKAWYVTCADYVTLSSGSGIVHIAPAFGEDDAQVGKKYSLPFVQLVDEQGNFTSECGDIKGKFVKDADPLIIKDLAVRGLLYSKLAYEHSYPFCWRCDTPLLYYATDTWFVEMTKVREKLIANNNSINWIPETIKTGRMGNFIENVIDWGLSRSRYWGTPLPVWECASCGHFHVIGSIGELRELGGENVSADIELHRPYVDSITIACEKCGAGMARVSHVVDCWFDSGSMPFAQWHYPFENRDIFEKHYPANFISEAVDQTRGWFYTLLAISTLLFDQPSYRNCIVLGHVNDKDGFKMSKSKNNVVDPDSVLDKQGADAVRWYFCVNSALWLPSRFYEEAVNETQRKFMGTLWNTYYFFVLYANIDGFDPYVYELNADNLAVMDRWILSKLHTLIREVDAHLEEYRITEPARLIQQFTDGLSNWYVRRCRERYWESGMERDKVNAYMTLYTVLLNLSKLCAPFVPFIAEEIYLNLTLRGSAPADTPESVHLSDFPVSDGRFIDAGLESEMESVINIVELGRACRSGANIKNRQPLSRIYVNTLSRPDQKYDRIILEELNIKEIVYSDKTSEFIQYRIKPQLKTLGPKYGKILPKISAHLESVDGAAVFEATGKGMYMFDVDGTSVELGRDDILVETVRKEGYASESGGDATVVLDTALTDNLIEEGYVREIVSKLQTMRKEAGFEVLDRITVSFNGSKLICGVIDRNMCEIMGEVLADAVTLTATEEGYKKKWDINGEEVIFTVAKR